MRIPLRGTPNGTLDAGEDVNTNNQVDTWGKADVGLGFNLEQAPATPRKLWTVWVLPARTGCLALATAFAW